MPENLRQRTIRRGISHWLTEQVNKADPGQDRNRAIREWVLLALSEINLRFDDLRAEMAEKYHVLPERRLVDFYMKGGNAFKVSMAGQLSSGGDSDWDTQVVLDPWAPAPLLEILHGLVEDIALDALRSSAMEIAEELTDEGWDLEQAIKVAWRRDRSGSAVRGLDLSNYELKYDDPQTLGRIFAHDKLGLWFHSGSPLRDRSPDVKSKWIPGLQFNDSIRPFILYRMGYTWHVELVDQPDQQKPAEPITKPALMELIDVTIPRRNTVEGVEVWNEIATARIRLEGKNVGLDNVRVELSFPDLRYHLREQLDMLCEVADGSSRHLDKMGKRFKRLREIHEKEQDARWVDRIMGEQIGVAGFGQDVPGGPIRIEQRIYDLIDALPAEEKRCFAPALLDGGYQVNPGPPSYRLGILMMNAVVGAHATQQQQFNLDGTLSPAAAKRLTAARKLNLGKLLRVKGVTEYAWTDDLVLLDLVQQNDYLMANEVGLSGIDFAAICRVPDDSALNTAIEAVETAVALEDELSEEHELYNTAHQNGYSYGCIFVLFAEGKAVAMITFTTATGEEVAFAMGPGNTPTAPLVEVFRQRKMAASLIRDYIIRTALSRQYEAGKEIFDLV